MTLKIAAPIKNTLKTAAQKPSLKTVAAAALLVTPVGAVATIALANQGEIKNTLASVSGEVKEKTAVIGTKTVEVAKKTETVAVAGAKKASSVAGGIFDKLMLPLMVVGGLGLFMFLRK